VWEPYLLKHKSDKHAKHIVDVTVAEHCMGSCGSSVETYRAGVGRIGKNFSDYIASFRIASFARDVVESWKGDAYIHTKSCKQGVSLACYVGVDA